MCAYKNAVIETLLRPSQKSNDLCGLTGIERIIDSGTDCDEATIPE